jgi:hypothetical protein
MICPASAGAEGGRLNHGLSVARVGGHSPPGGASARRGRVLPYFVRLDVFETRTGRPPEGIPPFAAHVSVGIGMDDEASLGVTLTTPTRVHRARWRICRACGCALQATDQPECEE